MNREPGRNTNGTKRGATGNNRRSRRRGNRMASGIVMLGAAGLLYSKLPGFGLGGGFSGTETNYEQVPQPTVEEVLPTEGSELNGVAEISPEPATEITAELTEDISAEDAGETDGEKTEDIPSAENAEPGSDTDEETDYGADSILSIEVIGEKILYEGDEVTAQELEERLLSEYTKEKSISLTDDHAIKGTYDEVEAVLTKLSLG